MILILSYLHTYKRWSQTSPSPSKWKIWDHCLGVNFKQTEGGISMSLKQYILNLLDKFREGHVAWGKAECYMKLILYGYICQASQDTARQSVYGGKSMACSQSYSTRRSRSCIEVQIWTYWGSSYCRKKNLTIPERYTRSGVFWCWLGQWSGQPSLGNVFMMSGGAICWLSGK